MIPPPSNVDESAPLRNAVPGTRREGPTVVAVPPPAFATPRARLERVMLLLLTLMGAVAFLFWARTLLIPIAVSVIASFALNPPTRYLRRFGLPRVAAAGVVVSVLCVAGCYFLYASQDGLIALTEQVPAAAEKISEELNALRHSRITTVKKLQSATTLIEQLGNQVGPPQIHATAAPTTPIFNLRDFFWSGSLSIANAFSNLLVVSFLTFFLLASGDELRRKYLLSTGGGLSRQKRRARMLTEMSRQIQNSLLALLVANVIIGGATAVCFALLGVQQAIMWGVATAASHFIPYFGTALIAAASFTVSWLTSGNLQHAFVIAAVSLFIAMLGGTFITTILQSRALQMDACVMFVSLFVWGWLWGVWGLLLCSPLLAVTKVISEHVDGLAPVAMILANKHGAPRARRRRRRFFR